MRFIVGGLELFNAVGVWSFKASFKLGNLYKKLTESEDRVTFGFENNRSGGISV